MPANPEACLLGIAPELRNEICRLVLLENTDSPLANDGRGVIVIWAGGLYSKQPGLLGTCRQIREEASSIYYQENDFLVEVLDCDISTALSWLEISEETRRDCSFTLDIQGNPHWNNLKKWMEVEFEKRVFGVGEPGWPREPRDSPLRWSIPRALNLLNELTDEHEMTWSQVEPLMEMVHKLMVSLDPARA